MEVCSHRELPTTTLLSLPRKLWISGIPKNRTAEEIQSEMATLTEGVHRVILYPSQVIPSYIVEGEGFNILYPTYLPIFLPVLLSQVILL